MQILQHIPAVFGGFLVLVSYKHYGPFRRGQCTVCLVRKRGKPPHAVEKIYVHEMKESVEVLNQQFLQLRVFKAVNWTGMQVKHGSMSSFVVFRIFSLVYGLCLSNSWAHPHATKTGTKFNPFSFSKCERGSDYFHIKRFKSGDNSKKHNLKYLLIQNWLIQILQKRQNIFTIKNIFKNHMNKLKSKV